jgi:hypothetical protein
MQVLMTALICRRSPYIVEIEKELAAFQGASAGFTAHLLSQRADLKPLFRSEIQKIIQDARGEP